MNEREWCYVDASNNKHRRDEIGKISNQRPTRVPHADHTLFTDSPANKDSIRWAKCYPHLNIRFIPLKPERIETVRLAFEFFLLLNWVKWTSSHFVRILYRNFNSLISSEREEWKLKKDEKWCKIEKPKIEK